MEIIQEREEKEFESFEDLKSRIKGIPDPRIAIEKRILEEILERPRQILFVN